MEKVLLAKLIQAEQAISEITYKQLPLDYAEALLKFIEDAAEHVNQFAEINNKMIAEKYGEQKDGVWQIIQEKIEEYQSEIKPLLEKELDLEVPNMKLSVIKDANPKFTISTFALSHLKNFILYE